MKKKVTPPLDNVFVFLLNQPNSFQHVGDVVYPPLLLHCQAVCSLSIHTLHDLRVLREHLSTITDTLKRSSMSVANTALEETQTLKQNPTNEGLSELSSTSSK